MLSKTIRFSYGSKTRKDIKSTLTSPLQLCEERRQVLLRTELAADLRVVDDVVAEVAPPWFVERREPNASGVAVAGDAELFQVVQFLHHTWKNFVYFSYFAFENLKFAISFHTWVSIGAGGALYQIWFAVVGRCASPEEGCQVVRKSSFISTLDWRILHVFFATVFFFRCLPE